MRALLLVLLLACVAFGQPEAAPKAAKAPVTVPLSISAKETATVEIEKTVVVKEKLTVAKSFPIRISAPPGEDFYLWVAPKDWTVSRPKGKPYILVIEAAPNGSHVVKITCLTKGKRQLEGEITVVIDVTPAPPPP